LTGEHVERRLAADVAGYSRLIGRDEERTVADLKSLQEIAVRPFQNMSGDPEQEYFADGLRE
jgi:TolB-like protein